MESENRTEYYDDATRARHAAASLLAASHSEPVLAMAWRMAMQRQTGQDQFNLGHLR